jgi:hypothetical protein
VISVRILLRSQVLAARSTVLICGRQMIPYFSLESKRFLAFETQFALYLQIPPRIQASAHHFILLVILDFEILIE